MTTEPEQLDARGLKCPLPVLQMEKRLAHLPQGQTLVVLATDPVARIDIALFCRQHGWHCDVVESTDHLRFAISRGA